MSMGISKTLMLISNSFTHQRTIQVFVIVNSVTDDDD